ncbi:MAG: chorismate synthase, partial [Planctomycetota bacterium]
MSNTFGERFRVTTWGESHGPAVGAVVDGCPAGLPLSEEDLLADLSRDVPDSAIGTPRRE